MCHKDKPCDKCTCSKDVLPIITKAINVQTTEEVCPHCMEAIQEKSLYYKDNTFYHRSCKGAISFPPADTILCYNCLKLVNYAEQVEAGMGYVKCPHCGASIDQEGKVAAQDKERTETKPFPYTDDLSTEEPNSIRYPNKSQPIKDNEHNTNHSKPMYKGMDNFWRACSKKVADSSMEIFKKLTPPPSTWAEDAEGNKTIIDMSKWDDIAGDVKGQSMMYRFPVVKEDLFGTDGKHLGSFESTFNCADTFVLYMMTEQGWKLNDVITLYCDLCERCSNVLDALITGEPLTAEYLKSVHTHCDHCATIDPEYDVWYNTEWQEHLKTIPKAEVAPAIEEKESDLSDADIPYQDQPQIRDPKNYGGEGVSRKRGSISKKATAMQLYSYFTTIFKKIAEYDNLTIQSSDVPGKLVTQIRKIQSEIPEDLLITEEDSKEGDKKVWVKGGKQQLLHLTLLYGIEESEQSKIEEIVHKHISKEGIKVETAKDREKSIIYFDNEESNHTVAVVPLYSDPLTALHNELKAEVTNRDSYPKYQPHVTIAYLKLGSKLEDVGIDHVEWNLKDVEVSTKEGDLKKLSGSYTYNYPMDTGGVENSNGDKLGSEDKEAGVEKLNLKGLVLGMTSEATGYDKFNYETEHIRFINDNANLRLQNRDNSKIFDTALRLDKWFDDQKIREANPDMVDSLTSGQWRKEFSEMSVDEIFNDINWVGLHPVYEYMRLLVEQNPQLVITASEKESLILKIAYTVDEITKKQVEILRLLGIDKQKLMKFLTENKTNGKELRELIEKGTDEDWDDTKLKNAVTVLIDSKVKQANNTKVAVKLLVRDISPLINMQGHNLVKEVYEGRVRGEVNNGDHNSDTTWVESESLKDYIKWKASIRRIKDKDAVRYIRNIEESEKAGSKVVSQRVVTASKDSSEAGNKPQEGLKQATDTTEPSSIEKVSIPQIRHIVECSGGKWLGFQLGADNVTPLGIMFNDISGSTMYIPLAELSIAEVNKKLNIE